MVVAKISLPSMRSKEGRKYRQMNQCRQRAYFEAQKRKKKDAPLFRLKLSITYNKLNLVKTFFTLHNKMNFRILCSQIFYSELFLKVHLNLISKTCLALSNHYSNSLEETKEI